MYKEIICLFFCLCDRLNKPRNYLFFSHVIKAQPGNMPMLDHINDTQCRLFDYECITKGGEDGAPRLVAFGKYAGIAGMIDGLQGLGQRLLAEGYSTPFLNVPTSHMYQNMDQARFTLRNVGAQVLP
jgi:alpha-aminoadipic semialdehyde synthase